jgi:hypothetical protein
LQARQLHGLWLQVLRLALEQLRALQLQQA